MSLKNLFSCRGRIYASRRRHLQFEQTGLMDGTLRAAYMSPLQCCIIVRNNFYRPEGSHHFFTIHFYLLLSKNRLRRKSED